MPKNDFLVEMGNRLRLRRKQLKMTQDKVSEFAGLSVKTIIAAEKGQKALRPENIVNICKALDMDISYLLTGEFPHADALPQLDHEQRMALDQILFAFLSVCRTGQPNESAGTYQED